MTEGIKVGDVVPLPDRSIPVELPPEVAARKIAEIEENRRVAQAASDYLRANQPEVSNATEADLKEQNPNAIVSADVPIAKPEGVDSADDPEPMIESSDVPK